MTTATRTPLELAQVAEDEARAEAGAWESRKVALDTRGQAITAELDQLAGQLRAGRADALRGNEPANLPALAARERELKAEQEEVAARLEIARAEQTRTHSIFAAAAEAKAYQAIADQHARAVVRAGELDQQIDDAYAALIGLLIERGEIAEGSARMARAGIGGVAEIAFDWQRLPHSGLRSNRIPLPGTF